MALEGSGSEIAVSPQEEWYSDHSSDYDYPLKTRVQRRALRVRKLLEEDDNFLEEHSAQNGKLDGVKDEVIDKMMEDKPRCEDKKVNHKKKKPTPVALRRGFGHDGFLYDPKHCRNVPRSLLDDVKWSNEAQNLIQPPSDPVKHKLPTMIHASNDFIDFFPNSNTNSNLAKTRGLME